VRMTAHRPAETLREPVPGRSERAERGLPDPERGLPDPERGLRDPERGLPDPERGLPDPERGLPDPERGLPDPERSLPDPERGLPDATILSICDDLLGEVGRRDHIFAWLRAPGADIDEWLPVDAYYPRARLVVMSRSDSRPHGSAYRELIPAHGLGLMTLDPAALGDDREAVREALAAKLFDLEHVPREQGHRERARPERRPPREPQPGAPEPQWTPVKVEHTSVPRGYVHGAGVLAGLALAAVLILELYLGVIVVAVHDGRLLLGLAIALEACSRVLGTVAAERAGQRGWAFACAIFGAPVVAWFALLRPSGRVEVEPAPLAGLLAVLAGLVAVIGILIGT